MGRCVCVCVCVWCGVCACVCVCAFLSVTVCVCVCWRATTTSTFEGTWFGSALGQRWTTFSQRDITPIETYRDNAVALMAQHLSGKFVSGVGRDLVSWIRCRIRESASASVSRFSPRSCYHALQWNRHSQKIALNLQELHFLLPLCAPCVGSFILNVSKGGKGKLSSMCLFPYCRNRRSVMRAAAWFPNEATGSRSAQSTTFACREIHVAHSARKKAICKFMKVKHPRRGSYHATAAPRSQ